MVRARHSHPALRISMVVPTFYRRTRLAHDVLEKLISTYSSSKSVHHREAVKTFERLRAAGKLVPRRDPDNKIATFVGFGYEEHRFAL